MSSSTQAPRRVPPRAPGNVGCGRSGERPRCLRPKAALNQTNPIEPIEIKMRAILRNRTHWNYLVCLQRLAAKKCPISGNYVPSRTRICPGNGTGVRPSPKTILECRLDSNGWGTRALPRTRIRRAALRTLGKIQSRCAVRLAHQAGARCAARQQSRNVVLFQGGGERGYVTHQDSDARRPPHGRRGGRAGDSAKSADRMPFQGP